MYHTFNMVELLALLMFAGFVGAIISSLLERYYKSREPKRKFIKGTLIYSLNCSECNKPIFRNHPLDTKCDSHPWKQVVEV